MQIEPFACPSCDGEIRGSHAKPNIEVINDKPVITSHTFTCPHCAQTIIVKIK